MAAKAAMEADRATVNYMIEAFKERRLIMIEGMRSIPGLECNEPEGAFYLFPKVSSCFGKSIGDRKIENAEDLAMYLLEVAHVATVPGSAFGADDYLRLSYAAANPVLVEAISRIKTAIEQLEA